MVLASAGVEPNAGKRAEEDEDEEAEPAHEPAHQGGLPSPASSSAFALVMLCPEEVPMQAGGKGVLPYEEEQVGNSEGGGRGGAGGGGEGKRGEGAREERGRGSVEGGGGGGRSRQGRQTHVRLPCVGREMLGASQVCTDSLSARLHIDLNRH